MELEDLSETNSTTKLGKKKKTKTNKEKSSTVKLQINGGDSGYRTDGERKLFIYLMFCACVLIKSSRAKL